MSNPLRYRSGGRGHHGSTLTVAVMAVVCMMVPMFSAFAQPLSTWNWYFGQRAGITFRGGSIEAISDGQLNTSEGCASVSDPNSGELLFYTDGVTVWNRLHDVMPNGTDLFGDKSTSQSALIVPAPGRPWIFYVFNPAPVTSSTAGSRCLCLSYSIVDMRADAGFGEVVKKNEVLLNDVTEHLTATADCRGDGWWIVARSRSTRHFFSLHLTRDVLTTTPVFSDAGNPTLVVREAGQMHISPDSRQLVITSAAGSSQLYDFDSQTGKVTNGINLFRQDILGSHYGAAFSPDSKKLYVSVANEGSITPTRIYQFSIDVKSPDVVANSKFLLGDMNGVYSWTPMQLASDGRVYIGRPGEPWLAMISFPNEDTSLAVLRDTAIRLTGTCRFGLPNMIGSSLIEASSRQTACSLPRASFMSPRDICAGACTSMRDSSTGVVDTREWTFAGGSPSSSGEIHPQQVCYKTPGTYPIRLVVSNGFGTDTAYSTITVLTTPTVTVDSVPEVCPRTRTQLRAVGASTYVWSPANLVSDPTRPDPFVQPSSTTRYTVIGTNLLGCKDTTTVLVRVTDISAGGDAIICAGATVQLFAHGADTYSWSPTLGLSDPTSSSPLASPATTTHYVVTMQRGACLVVDTVLVTVIDTFSVKINGPDRTCVGDTLILSASAGSVHEWTGEGVIDRSAVVARVVMGNGPTLIRLTSRSGNCSDDDSLLITPVFGPPIDLGSDVRICEGESTILTARTMSTDVTWSPAKGLDRTDGAIVLCSPLLTTTYIASVRGDSGCTRTDTITVEVLPLPAVDAGPDVSVCEGGTIQLQSTGNAERYIWSPSIGLSDSSAVSPSATPQQTTTYVVRALTGACERVDSVIVFVSTLNVAVTKDTSICRGESVQLMASGATRYAWTPVTALSDPNSAQPLATPQTTTTYTVRGSDQLGCEQVKSVTVVVRDTSAIRLIAGSITARAGSDDVGIPIILEVPASMLPLMITELRATLVNDASVFLPDSTDRGALRTSVRGPDRLSYLLVENVQVISTRQKITEVRGLVLAGHIQTAPLRWEDLKWQGEDCLRLSSTNGLLYISGCNLTGRLLRTFQSSFVTARAVPSQDVIAVDLKAYQPGEYQLQLVSVDGRTIWLKAMHVGLHDGGNVTFDINMSAVATGLYTLVVLMPNESETVPIVWFK